MSDAPTLQEREVAAIEGRLQLDRESKERELQVRRRELSVGRWTGPVAVAVIAGIIGIGGTYLTARQNLEIERKKQEGSLILDAIRTGANGQLSEQQAAANLVFLADAGLVSLGADQVEKLRGKAGTATPGLPTATTPTTLPEDIRQRILKSFDQFAAYFTRIGAGDQPKVGVELIPPGSPFSDYISYYDAAKTTVYISPLVLNDERAPLRDYAHSVLSANAVAWAAAIGYDRTWAYAAIESGLASYFGSSFSNNPTVPGTSVPGTSVPGAPVPGSPPDTLDNDTTLASIAPGSDAMGDGIDKWGGAFWALRKALGPDTDKTPLADRILLKAWLSLTAADVQNNDPKNFLRALLKADADLYAATHAPAITALFTRRGLPL